MDNYSSIPTWDNGVWTTTGFKDKEDFKKFALTLFKEPGKYKFNDTSFVFNSQARYYNDNRHYCLHPQGTRDFIDYWDDQKKKCREGVIFKSGKQCWYLTRDYYMWINFLPIFNKEIQRFGFANIYDTQYHMALYELLAELHYKHAAIVKKRQIASSYYHAGKLINQLWFEEGVTLKMGASLKDYINDSGTWKYLNEYKSFLNQNTAWYRPMNPDKVMMWQQKTEISVGPQKRKSERGLKGVIKGISFEKDPTNGVGGPCKYFFHEEAGIAPKMDTTFEYMRPAMKSGLITTGVFIAAGSVGDLSQCEPLKKMILKPESNDIYAVDTNLIDAKGTIGKSGLFIPEQWSMPPYIDEYGNSDVEGALAALEDLFAQWKKELDPSEYQLRISQSPRNIEEAFDYREESPFPQNLVSAQLKRIEDKQYGYELLDIYRDEEGRVKVKQSTKLPIDEFPISKKREDKEGILQVWERPSEKPEFGEYYASIDPVGVGKTTTSESLCSIIIYKNSVEVTRHTDNGTETFIEPGKIVATWTGRFDDINKTHERLELIIEWYNAWSLIENNISQFINHMIHRKKQKYLVPKSQILFLKDISANANVFQEYGWKNVGRIFTDHLLKYGIDFLKEELDHETKENGDIVRTTYGIERIPDPMILKEMKAYVEGLNVDRLVSYCALTAFIKIQEANRGYKKKVEDVTKSGNFDKSNKFSKLGHSPFTNLGGSSSNKLNMSKPRNPFKNLK